MPRPKSPVPGEAAFLVPWKVKDGAVFDDQSPDEGQFSKALDMGHWQAWLLQWEERQRMQFQSHQAAMQEIVQASTDELMEKLNLKLARARPARPPGKKLEEKKQNIFEEKEKLRQKEKGIEAETPPATENSDLNISVEEEEKKPRSDYNGLNDALVSACGHAKNKKGVGLASRTLNTLTPKFSESSSERPRPKHITAGSIRHGLWVLTNHPCYDTISCLFIALYALFIGLLAHYEMKAVVQGIEVPPWRYYVDMTFTTIFIVDVALKIAAQCKHFFIGSDWKWNNFDFFVAAMGAIDSVAVFDFSLSHLRMLRCLRAIRVLRVVRIFRFFKELRLMVDSILCCLASLSWAFVLMISIIYLFSVLLLQGASDYLNDPEDVRPEVRRALADDFGDMWKALYSLAQAVSGGRSWGEYASPFVEIHPGYAIVFTFFIVFSLFGLLNILTGIFVESTSSLASFDKELVVQEEMSRNESVVGQIRQLFRELDSDQSGTLSYKELKNNLKDERVRAYFSVLQLDVSEAYGLFQLLDRDESGEVSIEEFIMSCMRLKGGAKSIDLASMLFESKRSHTLIKGFMTTISDVLVDLRQSVQEVQAFTVPPLEEGNEKALEAS